QVRSLQGTDAAPSAIGRVYVDPQVGTGMIMVRALPPLPTGRAYQLRWVRPDGKRESGGLLTWTDQGGNGYGFVQCPVPCAGFNAIGVTEEPSGGSAAPTGQRLLGG
ncbi:MAG: anti-sigma factor, partial [Chloroflexi bacterium]|nr:anti-sigma factor [Chloroflexota bacterium]